MKSFTLFAALLLAVCFLLIHECDAGRRQTKSSAFTWRKRFFLLFVKKAASAICRSIFSVEKTCRSCNCRAPVTLSCLKSCAIREEIRKCARELLCPSTTTTAATTTTTPPTTATVPTTTSATTEGATAESTLANTESTSTTTESTSTTTESTTTTTSAEITTGMTCGGFCVGGFCPVPVVGTCTGSLTCCSTPW
ncbi:uncharacterized protein [Haliotis asinina]|uniref:uncharacterized protein n=1 Tax=Haliotis asinina TaxID=109174 RepID=UPI0035320103